MKDTVKGTILINETTHYIETFRGSTVLEAFRHAGITVYSPCGGNGTCGKCRAIVRGNISAPCDKERKLLSDNELARGVRLACMCEVNGDFTAEISIEKLDIETQSHSISYPHSPMIYTKKKGNRISFYTRNGELLDTSDESARNLGLAVDIGTTTVAVYLCDMDTREMIDIRAIRNPQGSYGADVISRIDKIMKNKPALQEQQKLIIDAINQEAKIACRENELRFSDIRAVVIGGNTVMQHIVAGIDPSSIANAPFIAPTLFGEEYSASKLGLLKNEKAVVYFSPCFASYVGGDIACGVIATGIDACDKNVLFVDIGTNGEIGLSTHDGLYFCSAAAGPALEGAQIECGMPGVNGAISEISVDSKHLVYKTIGGIAPIGICGSGIIDAVASMLEMELLDETGCIADESESFAEYIGKDRDENPCFQITKNIYLTGKDIREIQLAKAAICAGIRTLLKEAKLAFSDIDKVMIAGGFGSHIRKESACRIGLIPKEFLNKITFVGNTAGAGAVSILLSRKAREIADTIREKSKYLELSQNATFMEQYIEEMMFEE